MPRVSCVVFAAKHLLPDFVKNKRVLDVGACDYNGSIRPLIASYGPSEYIGIDIEPGPLVDRLLDANDIVQEYGKESFDIIICLEMLEHTYDWQKSLTNIKEACKPGGRIIITTPAPGYNYHGYPHDYWRYDVEDLQQILSDFNIIDSEYDASAPGSFICAEKPQNYTGINLAHYRLHSVVTGNKINSLTQSDFNCWHFKKTALKQLLKNFLESTYRSLGRFCTKALNLK